MTTLTQISRTTQQFVCAALAAIVVASSLTIGAWTAELAAHNDYSVTITQIQ